MDDLAAYGQANQKARKSGPSASNVGGCQKRIAAEFLGMPQTNTRSTTAADLGTLLHLGYSAVISARYPEDGDEQHRAPYAIEVPELERSVEADHVDFTNRVVDDLKSAKSVVWQGWVNRATPPSEYWDQAEFYAFMLRRAHGGDWTLRITAFNRETGERAVFEQEADPERGQALLDRQVALLGRLHEAAAEPDPLAAWDGFVRGGKGPGTGFPCDYCPFLDACWPPTGPDDPRTPQSKAIDGDESAVADALAQYDEGRALEGKGKRMKDEARLSLTGLSAGAYGDYALGWGKPSGGSDVPDCDAMAAYFTEQGMAVPMRTTAVRTGPISVNRRKS